MLLNRTELEEIIVENVVPTRLRASDDWKERWMLKRTVMWKPMTGEVIGEKNQESESGKPGFMRLIHAILW